MSYFQRRIKVLHDSAFEVNSKKKSLRKTWWTMIDVMLMEEDDSLEDSNDQTFLTFITSLRIRTSKSWEMRDSPKMIIVPNAPYLNFLRTTNI